MYRFVDPTGTALTPAEMCDNSPLFLEDPTAVTILNPFDTAVSNNFAQDLDPSDDVRFYIDFPWSGPGSPCNYNQGYTVTNPLPGLFGGQAVDSITGLIRYRPNLGGSFQTAIRAESRRCGQKISEIFRDFQLTVIANPAGSRPVFNPNAAVNDQRYQQKGPFFLPFRADTNNSIAYNVEIYVKDTLRIPLLAYDIFPLYDSPNPPTVPLPVYNPDSLSLFVTGPQMGMNGTSTTTGCLFPPCATISQSGGNPPIPIRYFAGGVVLGYGYADIQNVNAQLNWVPNCSNLTDSALSACGTGLRLYQFGVVALDDNSPIRGKSLQVYTVRVKDFPPFDPPTFRQVSLDPTGQRVNLSWSVSIDTTNIDPIDLANHPNASTAELLNRSVQRRLDAFGGVEIERADQPSGPFVTLVSLTNLNASTWVDSTTVSGQTYYYRVASVAVNGCISKRNYSEVLKTIRLVFGHDWATATAQLSWDSLGLNSLVPSNFTGQVLVERENYTMQRGFWQVRGASMNPLTQYSEIPQTFGDSLNYRIGFVERGTLVSYSQAFGSTFDLDALSVESQELTRFQVYPNPAERELQLKLAENLSGFVAISIYDMRGRLVQQKQLFLNNEPIIGIEITELKPGIYQLQLRHDNQSLGVQRFVKR